MESSKLRGKRILVTGGAGFIGSHIVDRLLEYGARVVVVDNMVTGDMANLKQAEGKIEFVKGDVGDERILDGILENTDYVLHQAALRSVPKSVGRPLDYHYNNVTATLTLFLKAHEKKVKRIVYASSSSVYGERKNFPEKETDLPSPLSPYAATKLMGEHYACVFSRLYRLEVVSLRYFNVFGPRQSLESKYAVVVPKFIVSLIKGEHPPVYGDGEQERDFTYINDVVRANIAALLKEGIGGEVFNIASSSPCSVNRLLKILKGIMGKNIEAEFFPPRPGDVRKTHADISKAEKKLAWVPQESLEEGLQKTVKWFVDNIERYQ